VHLAIYNAAHESNFEACIPNAGQYMHETYLNIARMLWKEPFLLYDVNVPKQEYMKNMVRLEKITKRCMLDTFVFMLPFKEFDEQLAASSDSSDYLEDEEEASEEEEEEEDDEVVEYEDDEAAEDEVEYEEEVAVDELVADEVAVDEQADDEVAVDELVADEVAADEVAVDEQADDEVAVDELVADEVAVSEQAFQEEVVASDHEDEDEVPDVINDTTVGGIDKLIGMPCPPLTKSIDLSADEEEETNVEVPDDPDLRVVTIAETPQRRTLSERKKLVKEIVKKRGFPDFAKPKDSFF
jgi:hypothetical protein